MNAPITVRVRVSFTSNKRPFGRDWARHSKIVFLGPRGSGFSYCSFFASSRDLAVVMFRKSSILNTVSIILSAILISAFVTFSAPAPKAKALSTEVLKPTSYTWCWKGSMNNPTYAYDFSTGGDNSTYNDMTVGGSNRDPTMEYHTWQTSSNNHSERRLYVRRSGTGNSDDSWGIWYSTNGGTDWTAIETGLTNPSVGTTTAVTISTSLDLSQLEVKVSTIKNGSNDGGYAYIYDVWLECEFTSFPLVGTNISPGDPIQVSPGTLTPQEEWTTITVPVWHGEDLGHIDAVEVKLFYDSAGTDPAESGFSANVQTCAILTWTRDGAPEWDIDPSTTTWAINSSGCSKPNDSVLQDNWVFSFKIGKVATYSSGAADWDIFAEAVDYNYVTSSDYLRDTEMNYYSEVVVNTGSVSWSGITPGMDFGESTKETDISVTYIMEEG